MPTTRPNPVILALDLGTTEDVRRIIALTRAHVAIYKLGLELFVRFGPGIVAAVRSLDALIMLDLKLHDIPNTVKRATRNAAALGVEMLTIHASGGAAMMRAAREAVDDYRKESGSRGPKLLGVTVLTSLDQQALSTELGVGRPVQDQVVALAVLARESGLDGVVASPREIGPVRSVCGPGFLIVTPGIRPAGTAAGDQKRTLTPHEAVAAGADYIVVGRPVLDAADPLAVLTAIHKELA